MTMQSDTLSDRLRHIKLALRGVMNGVTSASMRQKGLNYKLIFGVELPRLREMAEELPHDYDLAAALWKEDIRECRLLAGMLMPSERFDGELADIWVEQMRFAEEAECTVHHLFARLPFASVKAFEWIASESDMPRLCGFLLLGRLFAGGARCGERDADEFLDQARTTLSDPTAPHPVRLAAHRALLHFMNLGEKEEAAGEALLDEIEHL